MSDIFNRILADYAAAQLRVAPPAKHVKCIYCDGGRYWTTYANGSEESSECRICAGKGTVVIEVSQ